MKEILKRNKWYIFIVFITSIYVYIKYEEIMNMTSIIEPLSATGLIFIVWIIILLFPLFSEFDFMGIKLKKELYETKKEIKDEISKIYNLFTLYNKISIKNVISNNSLPDEKLLKYLLEIISSYGKEAINKQIDDNNKPKEFYNNIIDTLDEELKIY